MDAVTPWYVPVARAIPAIALAIAVAFTPGHSAPLGYLTFGIFAVVSGAVLAASALRADARGIARAITLAQGLITVLAGIVALALPQGGLPFLVFLVTAFAAITGFLELYLGLRGRQRTPRVRGAARTPSASRDRVFVGGLTALLAIAVLLVPPDFVQPLGGLEGVEGRLTASVIVVGALGVYWVILGVYLVIAGLSLKWAAEPAPETAVTGSEG